IISHRNPDGDAIGSSMGLYWFLKKKGHELQVIFPSDYPSFVAWIPDSEKCLIYDIEPQTCDKVIEQANAIFCLDFNGLDRIDPFGKKVDEAKGAKIMIDHHLYPEGFCELMISDTAASSTCELVYELIKDGGYARDLDPRIADCLLTGLITDTGSFRYATSSRTLQCAAALHAAGANNEFIQEELRASHEKVLRLLGHCLYNRMEVDENLQTAFIWLTKQDFEDFNIQRGDTEGIVNQMLKMKKVKVAVFIKEQPTIIKLSLRSKGDFSVQKIMTKHFNGGGHKNASGGYFYGTINTCINKMKKAIREQQEG
ncbi:MAG: DHH family phosphoesterase, partial [Saprospiraceae bacterium]